MNRHRSPTRNVEGYGRRAVSGSYPLVEDVDYLSDIIMRMRRDAERMRRERRGRTLGDEVDRFMPQPIEVDATEFYCKDNAKAHQTSAYDLTEGNEPTPVFRRGQPFYMAIRFKRPFSLMTDKVRLELSFGPRKLLSKGTLVFLPVTPNVTFVKDRSEWDVCTNRQEKTILTIQVQIPPTAPVGLWRMKITTQVANSSKVTVYDCKDNIYILFNPWCKDDLVYMSESTWRQEYVMNDNGKIFMGSYNNPVGRPWIFGQFESAALPASVLLLEKSGLDATARGNPIKVARAISAMVNSNDDNGVLIGRWSNDYDDGTAPYVWTGSTAILEQYLSNGGTPVRYGQCWVFSGVCTTVCRALGIPCRSVTNFVSAHDTDDSLTVDIYLDSNGETLDELNMDSMWNFHVWNDCWMARPDLPHGYGGWQAIDATPQETSEGTYRAGPASVVAIRRGEISHLYDAPFVFAEVNADIVHWQVDETAETGWKKLKTNTYHVGRMIVTKRVGFHDEFGDRDMENILLEYKSKEGTQEERMAIRNAARRFGVLHIHDLPPPGKEDVSLKLRDIDKVMIGRPFQVIVEVENRSDEKRTVQAVLSASTVYYTGITAAKVKRARGSFILRPRQKEELGIDVTADDYLEKLVDYSMMKIYAIATVKETKQTWSEEDDFTVEKPTLRFEIEGVLKIYRRFNLRVTFANPLNKTLQNCEISVEGPGLAEPHRTKLDDIGPYGTLNHVETLVPRKAGTRRINAVFSSRQLIEVTGSKQVEIMD